MNLGRNNASHSFTPSNQSIPKLPKSEAVQVVVRCRPMSFKEQSQGHTQIIDMWPQRGIVHIFNPRRRAVGSPGSQGKMFTFDCVYDWNANQDDLYDHTVKPLVYSVLDGYNGTIFAYGQTGTGKTYTMLGSRCNPKEKGIISKCFEDIFKHIAFSSDRTSFVVRASYLEIYQEETRDLLSPDVCKKPLREDIVRGVYVKGLQSVVCKNIRAIERVMRLGNMNRATAATNMNEHSSRSHAIFQITIEMRDRVCGAPGNDVRVGKLNLVDLAGSERQCKTGAVGDRLKESTKINLSLSALGNVISALVDGRSSHIPYRDSKLTQLLQDSLGGNSKSIMIANIGPASYNYDESLMTLRYASRAKQIKNRPTRNENPSNATLSHYKEMRALSSLILGCQEDSAPSPERERGGPGGPGGRRRRPLCGPHRRFVWKLHGKYRQETTVQMVRWIREQIECGRHHWDCSTAEESKQEEAHDELPYAATLATLARSTNTVVRAFLAAEVKELRARAQRQHQRQRAALHADQARLRKELALKHAVLRTYLADLAERAANSAPAAGRTTLVTT